MELSLIMYDEHLRNVTRTFLEYTLILGFFKDISLGRYNNELERYRTNLDRNRTQLMKKK